MHTWNTGRRHSWLLWSSVLLLWNMPCLKATICEFCQKDFTCIGRHTWRCPARITSATTNTPNVSPDSFTTSQETIVNKPITLPADINESQQLIRCACGKECKGRRGLKAHQRNCKISKLIHEECANIEDLTGDRRQEEEEPQQTDEAGTNSTFIGTDGTTPNALPGIKLPKTKQQWAEANLYFRLNIDFSSAITDIEAFTSNLQKTVYKYFADNYGTVKNDNKNGQTEEYSKMSIKHLKRELAQMKKNQINTENIDNIRRVSGLIRRKLKPTKFMSDHSKNDIACQLAKNFWKTCKSVFECVENVIPSFDLTTCFQFFQKVMHQSLSRSFKSFPEWIPQLNPPSFPCSTEEPTYKEITRAINKCKSKACPCPLDQLSIIILKRCPIMRTILHKLIQACWQSSSIPSSWKRSLTVLIYKKGDKNDPANFRPITLQPVLYKVLASVIRDRIYAYLENNCYVDKRVQKGFWPRLDGVFEHTQMLSQLMKEAKRHQRSLVVTLLDLRNAFGEVNHRLIYLALQYHHVPEELINLVKDIYNNSLVSVAHYSGNTQFMAVERGVLQGDPCSPLIFNMCFNPLMKMVTQPKFEQLGYMWGPTAKLRSRSWLQFADDTAILSHDMKSAQSLLNLNTAWCEWADMKIRVDKCSTFGMRKEMGNYVQYQPNLIVGDKSLPAIEDGASFKYLGKCFDFSMDHSTIKSKIKDRLSELLKITSYLSIKSSQKLKILRLYIPSQLSFDLRIYSISYTWIAENLDSQIINAVRNWLELPVSSCISEILSLPSSTGGLNIPSLKDTAEKLRLGQRFNLHRSNDEECHSLWKLSSEKNIYIDSIITKSSTKKAAKQILTKEQSKRKMEHINSLSIQGKLISAITEEFSKSVITKWTRNLDKLATQMFNFVRKALQQQLPTASNLQRWGKTTDSNCPLCQKIQTNKHVLSNCGSSVALERYKTRHDSILTILVDWIRMNVKPGLETFADLEDKEYRPLSELFQSLRPDMAVLGPSSIDTLELTVCHETNLSNSKQYKQSRYSNLISNVNSKFTGFKLTNYTIEVTTLGLISDITKFCSNNLTMQLPDHIINNIFSAAISNSYLIYCNRNKNT